MFFAKHASLLDWNFNLIEWNSPRFAAYFVDLAVNCIRCTYAWEYINNPVRNDDMMVMVQRAMRRARFRYSLRKLQARLFPIHEASFSISRQAVTRFAHCAMFSILLMAEKITIGTIFGDNDYYFKYINSYLQHFMRRKCLNNAFQSISCRKEYCFNIRIE